MTALPGGNPPPITRAAAIGRYLVLSMIGKGGMGEVYAAYDPELDRKVAIKLLRVRGDQAEATAGRARLMREAQAIAKLSHPNVVVVYDVGAFHDQVFMAMEFVDGHTLSYWMHAAPRHWTEVIKVFSEAGRGLAAAHEKDLVHRDFKPDNVMIGLDGQVRVMDFGLARVVIGRDVSSTAPTDATTAAPVSSSSSAPTATSAGTSLPDNAAPPPRGTPSAALEVDEDDLDSTRALARSGNGAVTPVRPVSTSNRGASALNLTETGSMQGTPAYMSPEQFLGRHTDARTDQFSFCVALYEALYGERPFAGGSLPSLTASVTEGRIRKPGPGSVVPGWLRDIVLRGLRVDPDTRWPSLRALLAELEVDGEAAARSRDFEVRARSKLTGIWEPIGDEAPTGSPARQEMRCAFLATGKRYAEAAYENASRALDRYAGEWVAMYTDACEATHVRGEQSAEVLDLRMASLNDALDSLRALTRAFRSANGDVVENAVDAAHALPSIERCADIKALRAVVRPPEEAVIRAAVDRLRTELAEARVACSVGRFNDGLKAVARLEEVAREIGYGPVLAEILLEAGRLHNERRDAVAAAASFEETVWTAELARHDEVAAEAAVTLVYAVGDNQIRFDAGEIWARHAEMLLRRLGGHDRLWGWLYNNRGAMRMRQGRLAESLDDQRRAVAAKEKAGGPENTDVALSVANMAVCLEQMGETEEAAIYAERALRILEGGLGPQHPRTLLVSSNFAEILNQLGRFDEARAFAHRALDALEGEVAPTGSFITFPLMALARGHLGAGQAAAALPLLERVAAIREVIGMGPSLAAEVHFALARALANTGGDPVRARALATRARAESAQAPATASAARSLAQIDAWLAGERTATFA
jgi:serine/threonine protein kinase/tetratricopeptide (TPR) repeat protein